MSDERFMERARNVADDLIVLLEANDGDPSFNEMSGIIDAALAAVEREALERAAQACEDTAEGRVSLVAINACNECREAIRALADPSPAQPRPTTGISTVCGRGHHVECEGKAGIGKTCVCDCHAVRE